MKSNLFIPGLLAGALLATAGIAGAGGGSVLQRANPDIVKKAHPVPPMRMTTRPHCIAGFSVRNAQQVDGQWRWKCVSQKPIRCSSKFAPFNLYAPVSGSGGLAGYHYNGGAFSYECDLVEQVVE